MRRGWSWSCQSGEGRVKRVLSTAYRYFLERCRKDGHRLLLQMNCDTSRGNTKKMENSDWVLCKKNHHEGDQKLVWVTYEILSLVILKF